MATRRGGAESARALARHWTRIAMTSSIPAMTEETPLPKRFGNTWKTLGQTAVVGLVIGLILYAITAATFIFSGGAAPGRALVAALLMIPIPALTIPLFILPTVLFSLHVRGEWLEHRFLERVVIERAPLADFESFRLRALFFAVVLNFKDGKHIHYIGGPDVAVLTDTMQTYASPPQ